MKETIKNQIFFTALLLFNQTTMYHTDALWVANIAGITCVICLIALVIIFFTKE